MSRLPNPGGDEGQWGALLNDYLSVSHDAEGKILPSAVADSLAGGTNGQILTADDTQPTGVKWTNPAGVAHFAASTAVIGTTPTDRAYGPRTLSAAYARVGTAPAGSNLIIGVQHWNGTTWTTIGTVTVPAGSTAEASSSFSQAQVAGNQLRLNIISVGSSVPASGVAVDVLWS